MDDEDPEQVPLAQAWDLFGDPTLLAAYREIPAPRAASFRSTYVHGDDTHQMNRQAQTSLNQRQKQARLGREIVADMVEKLRTGRLFAGGLVEPITLTSVPADIPPHLRNILRPSQNSARARNGKLAINDVRARRASSGADPACRGQDEPEDVSDALAPGEVHPKFSPQGGAAKRSKRGPCDGILTEKYRCGGPSRVTSRSSITS